MDSHEFDKHKPFAGQRRPSMLRRRLDHDYSGRQMYLITIATAARRHLLGTVSGTSHSPLFTPSPLGQRVEDCWWDIQRRHKQIEIIAFQLMPDHIHGILFVKEQMEKPLGKVILGFKQGCNKAFRELFPNAVECAAVVQRHTRQEDNEQGLLFAKGYNDRLLLRRGQLERWIAYLQDNPRRLLMKREHPEFFRVQRNIRVGEWTLSALGNRFLLAHPHRLQVQLSRRLTDDEIQERVDYFLGEARRGAVLVSPAISKGEKAVMRAAFDAGYPIVYLQENGLTELAKPSGQRMEACSRGQLLIVSPWQHHNTREAISRQQCLSLNALAALLCAEETAKDIGE